jgi:hypothetical protein
MATSSPFFALRSIAAPRLPNAPFEYDARYQDQLLNVLRLYFNQLDNFILALQRDVGGAALNFPYGAFSSTADQTAAAANTAYVMTFNTTDYANGVIVASSSRLTAQYAGIYNLQWSGQFENTSNAIQDIRVWLKINGTAVTGSTGLISIPARKSASAGEEAHEIYGWNYFVSLNATDYVELWWQATSTAVSIQHYAAGANYPSTASVIATLQFVSNLQT